jgi:hypothetical protein
MTYKDLTPELQEAYSSLDKNAKKALLVWDGDVLRFKANRCVKYYIDSNEGLLNNMWAAARKHKWPKSHLRKFYRMMGYSLSGYLDVFAR